MVDFFVKSAYYMKKAKLRTDQGESSRREQESQFWQAIWRINAPNTVKNFLWRAFNDVLPTRVNLAKKKI